jgi:hypothetical protein
VITKGEGTVGECSDRSIVRMQSRKIVVSLGSRQVLTLDISVLVVVQYVRTDGVYIMSCIVCFLPGDSPAPEFKCQHFKTLCLFNLHRWVGMNVFPSRVPLACVWVIALHSLFLYCNPPLPRHPPSDWLRLFSSQTV